MVSLKNIAVELSIVNAKGLQSFWMNFAHEKYSDKEKWFFT